MTTSNRLGITELGATQVERSVTVNEAIAKLEAGATCFASVSIGDTTPPVSPAEGDLYVLGGSPTGAWSGKGKYVAVYYDGAWFFLPPIEGALAYAQDDNVYYFYDGSAWSLFAGGGGSGDVVGPGSAVNNNIALFNLTTGKLIKDSGVAISIDGTLASNSDDKVTTEKGVKTYIDSKVTGLSWKQAVRAATTANGTLASAFANGSTIDGVTLATGDRILLKNQSSATENGIYVVAASGAPARATDADAGAEMVDASVYVSEGTTLADTQWTCTTNAPITVGSTSLTFAQAGIGGFTAASTTEVLTGTDAAKGVTADALAALWEKGADVASAGTVSLGEGGYFHITGTTGITDIDWATAKDGRVAWVIFDGILTLTNSSTLKLPGAANITTAAGDRACLVQDAGDNVICVAYVRADGSPLISTPYDVMMYCPGVPGNSALMSRIVVPRIVTFPSSLTGSYASSTVAATAATVLTIKQNGSSIGSINFAIGATTATFTFASPVTTAAGDVITITNQASADATLANISVTLVGSR